MLSAIILASGYSRRMGKNKLLLEYKGKTLIEHTLEAVVNSGFSEVILVAREKEILDIGNREKLKVIKNENAWKGISEGIKVGVSNSGVTEGFMFFTADQPFLDNSTIKLLMNIFKENPCSIVIPSFKGRTGSPVIFPYFLKADFLKLHGDVGGKAVINTNPALVKYIELKDGIKLFDVDTMESYKYILNKEEKS
ncbi:molybdenum cofactor cytidylyltransferase [Clostridium polynesiense]|uniref:molybdenum cofactor cytidylyltransferase n=1 Tax=Clostridium polynesiense TaxID=1325933 RepID=UPI00059120D3|nr:molybdenum cofactor cytidylyltransferase [Clostridium polynesiense]